MALNTKEVKWIEGLFKEVHEKIAGVRVDIATLKVKASVWGLLGGLIPVLITIAIYFIARK